MVQYASGPCPSVFESVRRGERNDAPGAQIDGQRSPVLDEIRQGRDMPLSQITYVDVVAHAGTVGRFVVVAEDLKPLALTDGHQEYPVTLDNVAQARLVFEFGPQPKPGKQKKKK